MDDSTIPSASASEHACHKVRNLFNRVKLSNALIKRYIETGKVDIALQEQMQMNNELDRLQEAIISLLSESKQASTVNR